jgi:hypothetical protein
VDHCANNVVHACFKWTKSRIFHFRKASVKIFWKWTINVFWRHYEESECGLREVSKLSPFSLPLVLLAIHTRTGHIIVRISMMKLKQNVYEPIKAFAGQVVFGLIGCSHMATVPTANDVFTCYDFYTSIYWKIDRGGQYGCETSRFPHLVGNQLIDTGEVVSFTRRPPFTPEWFLVFISVRRCVNSRTILQVDGWSQLINPVTSSDIEPATIQSAAEAHLSFARM